jgi:hypothetical protein
MKHFIYLIAFLVVVGCTNSTKTNEAKVVGEEPAVQEVAVLNVELLLEKALEYEGKEVMITGTVTHVCKHTGKRLHLMGNDENTMVRLEAGEIGQFDRELEGSEIIAKGVFRRQVIDEEYLAKWADELSKEGEGQHLSNEELDEEKSKLENYRSMMKETEGGSIENMWVDGISFEPVKEEAAI